MAGRGLASACVCITDLLGQLRPLSLNIMLQGRVRREQEWRGGEGRGGEGRGGEGRGGEGRQQHVHHHQPNFV